jgi:hypothetical protein
MKNAATTAVLIAAIPAKALNFWARMINTAPWTEEVGKLKRAT